MNELKGEMEVTPACYAHLLSPLMSLANGRVAVVLEGGYCLDSLAEGASLTLKTLLGDPCPIVEPLSAPCERFEIILKFFNVTKKISTFSIQETILNCIYIHRQYWNNLCLQDVYNVEELNNINPQSNLHQVPNDSFIGSDPPPIKFKTRDCYPIQNEAFRNKVSERLMQLRFFTNLTFPVNRVCYVYDEIMMQHINKFDG